MGYFQIEYNNKRLFGIGKRSDGGDTSGVTAYIIESKFIGSIALLRFSAGSREAFHGHAFNAITLWLKGKVLENFPDGTVKAWEAGDIKITKREDIHRVYSYGTSWALSLRGPWKDTWKEIRKGQEITLTHKRAIV